MDLLECWVHASERASALSWAHLCASSARLLSLSGFTFIAWVQVVMNVVAGLVRVSFVEWSTSVLLWYMLHVSSAKPWNLFGFTFITLLIFLFAWNFTFMCNFGGTLLNVLTNCCVFALITHVWRWFIWSVKSLSGF